MSAAAAKPGPLARYQHSAQPWALVTGATAGMGEAWAYALASHNFNVLIHGRNAEKLGAIESGIKSASPSVQVRTVVADASQLPVELEPIQEAIKDINLVIVINNVGGSGGHFDSVEEMSPQQMQEEIACNALFPSLVAQVTIKKLRQSQPSLMVNVSSIGGMWASPFITPYSASKAFNLHFSVSLHGEELANGSEIDVVCLAPGAVINGRAMQGEASAMNPLATTWVANAISAIAPRFYRARPSAFIVPHPAHAWSTRFLGLLPKSVANKIMRNAMVGLRDESRGKGKGSMMAGGGRANKQATVLGSSKTESAPAAPPKDNGAGNSPHHAAQAQESAQAPSFPVPHPAAAPAAAAPAPAAAAPAQAEHAAEPSSNNELPDEVVQQRPAPTAEIMAG